MPQDAFVYTLIPSPEHDLASHPENQARFRHFEAAFADRFAGVSRRLQPSESPSPSELTAVHPDAYLRALEQAVGEGPGYIDYAPTYVTPASYRCALQAAAATLRVTQAVIEEEAPTGFAVVRPPGHHATASRAMGFCLLNNVALAARFAQARGMRRVMIIDFDVHHGNGTQDITESDPDILYVSTHQEGIYPGSGALIDTGRGPGEGSVVNLPLPAGAGDRAFSDIAEQVFMPLADRFRPDLLLASAGYDAHWRDPLAGLQLTVGGYHRLALLLLQLAVRHCQGRAVFSLEGGYDPQALTLGVMAVCAAMAGEACPEDPIGAPPHPEASVRTVIHNACRVHGLT